MRYIMIVFVAMLFLSACGSGDVETKQNIRTTTTGQELLDLKKAHDAGAINDEQYEKQRKAILDRDG